MQIPDPPANAANVIEHLKKKWHGRSCQMCGTGNWNVQGAVFELRQFFHGDMVLSGPIIPVVPVNCTNCGNTVLVNAIIAGAMPAQVVAKESAEPKPAEVKP